MVYNETNEYNNTGENNNLWDNLRNLINQIDELKDDNKDNDELIWIFEQWNRALNDWLYNALNNCDINTLNEIEDRVSKIYSESDSIWISINVKSSLESLLQIITNIRNTREKDYQTLESWEDPDQEEKLEKEYKEIWSIWSMNPDDYNKMQESLGEKTFIKKIEKKWDRYSYSPEKLKSFLNDIKWNDWGGFLKMLDKGKNWNTEEERNDNMWKWRAVISAIQILLNEKFPNNPIIVDWKYGTKTKQRVKDFQDSNELKPDSKPWKNTINALLWNKIEETSENWTYIEIWWNKFLEQKDDKNNPYITREWQKYSKYESGKNWKSYYIPENKSYIYIWEIENNLFNWYWNRIDEHWNIYKWFFEDDYFKGEWVYSRAESWNILKWYFEHDLIQKWILKTKWDDWDEVYNVERDTYKWLKITNWDKKDKYIDDHTGYIVDNSTAIKDLTKEEIDNIERMRKTWIKIYERDFDLVKDLTQEQIDNIEKIRNIWFTIYEEDFDLVKDLTQEQIDNIETMWKIWIKIYVEDFDLVKDLTQEQIDNIKKIRNIWFDVNIDNIYDLTEFNEADFEILWINSEFLYESYDYTESEIEAHQNYKKWKIIENIEDFIQNVISENRDIGKSEIIEHIRSDLVTLPVKERISIIIWINKSVHKFNTVRKYLDFNNPENEYKTPKNLLCAIRWINDPKIISEITDDITVAQHWVWMMFFVWDEDSYEKIYDPDSSITNLSGWFQCPESDIEELEWTLCVINWVDPNNDTEEYSYWTIRHEWQHNRNTYFMPDRDQWPITYAKDEITAYLRDWRWIFEEEKREETIEQILTQSEDEWWLYQYDLKWEEWEQHKNQIRELLWYANDLIGLTIDPNTWLTRDNIISMLSCVPADQRKILHQNVMNAVKTHTTKELLDKFRRSWTAEKQTEIDEISVANSIEDIKHILSDPKYSHISRVPNNKWWIEISAIIDEVVAWRLAITYIPSEIRQYVQKFIKQ